MARKRNHDSNEVVPSCLKNQTERNNVIEQKEGMNM